MSNCEGCGLEDTKARVPVWKCHDCLESDRFKKKVAAYLADNGLVAVPIEPKCRHENVSIGYDENTCRDCGSINTDSQWGAASNMWFDNRAAAKFYRENGFLPLREGKS